MSDEKKQKLTVKVRRGFGYVVDHAESIYEAQKREIDDRTHREDIEAALRWLSQQATRQESNSEPNSGTSSLD